MLAQLNEMVDTYIHFIRPVTLEPDLNPTSADNITWQSYERISMVFFDSQCRSHILKTEREYTTGVDGCHIGNQP